MPSSKRAFQWRRHAFVLAALVAHASALDAQSPGNSQGAGASDAIPFDPSITVGTLPNGLRYYVQAHAVPAHRAELRLAVDAGSVLEEPTQLGVAHFVEHMAFDGSRHFAKLEIQHQLEAMGMQFGADLNAATTFDETTYRLTIPTDRPEAIATGVRILGDWAHGVTFDSAAVEAERGIVLSEWRMRTNAGASTSLTTRYLGAVLGGSAYGDRLPIGDPRIIQSVSRAELVRFYRRWYRPQRMAVVVVGDVDVASVVQLIERELGVIPAGPRTPETNRAFPARMPGALTAPANVVVVDSTTTVPTVSAVYRLPVRERGRRALRSALVERMVAAILAERVSFLDLGDARVEEQARRVRTWSLRSAVTSGEISETLARVLAAPAQVVRHGFTQDEVGRARVTLLTEYERTREARGAIPSGALADAYQGAFLSGASVPAADTLLALAREHLTGMTAIGLDEVNAAARAIFDQPGRVVFAALPRSGQSIEAVRVSAIADSIRRAPIPTYRDQFAALPLIPSLPPAGRVDSVREIPSIGTTVWVLSNGARVVLRPTDFRVDQLLVAAVASGGVSVAADSEYITARLVSGAVGSMGLGSFSPPALRRKLSLTGGQVAVSLTVDDLTHQISSSASPRDAKSLFEMLHLSFTAPRLDTALFKAWKEQTRAALSQPSAVADQEFAALRYSNHPRARPITAAMADSLDPNRSLAFYKARFADASAFTFFIVGAFSLDSIRPFVERYIASLPSTHAGEHWRDVGAREIEGPRTIDLVGGQPGRTVTTIIVNAPLPYDASTALRTDAVAEISGRRLNERLRTQLGATYGVNIASAAGGMPSPSAEISIQFDAQPERADSLAQIALDVLDSLARFGPTEREVAEVASLEGRRVELALRDNDYWLRTLSTNWWDGFDLSTGLVRPDARVTGMTIETIRATAAQLLNTRKAIRLFARPAGTPSQKKR